MSLIEFSGPEEKILELNDPELEKVAPHGRLPNGDLVISGYATDAAISRLQAAGLSVKIWMPQSEIEAARLELSERIARETGRVS